MRTLLTLTALLALAATLKGTPVSTLDGQPKQLSELLSPPSTLVLVVYTQDDLAAAQRLLTLAVSQDQPALILISLPDSRLRAKALSQAARKFFQSPFSRQHVHLLEQNENPYPNSKTLLLAPHQPEPQYASPTFPTELPKVAPPTLTTPSP